MQIDLSIIDRKTAIVLLLCVTIAFFCMQLGYRSNLNITLFSLAVIFPLVFTIREAFKRRDNVIQLLSVFKSSLNGVYYLLMNNSKMPLAEKLSIAKELESLSHLFFDSLYSNKNDATKTRSKLTDVFEIILLSKKTIPNGLAIRIFRYLKDTQESMENTIGISMHGTPVSLRAYCLVFIYFFPFIFVPTLIGETDNYSTFAVYLVCAAPGFILISLYNIQERMEDPFDQSGLDDIKVEEFIWLLPKSANEGVGQDEDAAESKTP
jgi:hypothetical protein